MRRAGIHEEHQLLDSPPMIRTSLTLALLAVPLTVATVITPTVALGQQRSQQYISDEITVAIRERPSNDAASLSTVKSGAPVTVLESLGPDSFARIRTSDGRTGWITARFLSNEPAAKTQLDDSRRQLGEARERIAALERELQGAHQKLEGAKSALEVSAENERLKAEIASLQQAGGDLQKRYDTETARRKTLLVGGGLTFAGIFLGLMLPLLGGRGKKRRYSEF